MPEKRTALITGASRGIGRAIAESFAEKYELILVCRRDVDDLRDLPGRHFAGDVGDMAFVQSVFREVESLDVLVNNAGISWFGLLQETPPEKWAELINTNLTSVYNTCHEAIPLMLKKHSGKIINISSVWGEAGAAMETAYSASKGGVNALTKALAKELAPSGIQVNAVACGVIDTDMNAFLSGEEREELIEEIPAGRMGRPEEVAQLVYSLASGHDYMTGQIITFSGGW